jgi:hypothetical protein
MHLTGCAATGARHASRIVGSAPAALGTPLAGPRRFPGTGGHAMKNWSTAMQDGSMTGAMAAAASLAMLALLGSRQNESAAAPINAVSHIAWGERALRRDRPSLLHTLTGTLLHVGSALFWGVLYERLFGRRNERSVATTVGKAALATAAIAGIDLKLVPDRLTPGFERRLSPAGVLLVYVALGAGLVVGSRMAAKNRPRP